MKNGSESVVHGSAAVSEKERVDSPRKFTVLSLPLLASAKRWRCAPMSRAIAAWREAVLASLAPVLAPAPARITTKTSHAKYKE